MVLNILVQGQSLEPTKKGLAKSVIPANAGIYVGVSKPSFELNPRAFKSIKHGSPPRWPSGG